MKRSIPHTRWDTLVFCLGVAIKCHHAQGLSGLTNTWLEKTKEYCLKTPVIGVLNTKICSLQVEEIGILELETSYRNMLKFCSSGLREEIREAIDTICLEGLPI